MSGDGAAPIGIVAGNAAVVGSVITRVVKDPAAGFFRSSLGNALEGVGGITWFAPAVGDIGDAGGSAHSPAHAGPFGVGPGGKAAPADPKVYAVIRDAQVGG